MMTEHEYMATVGANLRELRHKRGLSLQGVENESGGQLKAVVLASYERADRHATLARIAAVADFYGVDVRDVLPARTGEVAPDKNIELAYALECAAREIRAGGTR